MIRAIVIFIILLAAVTSVACATPPAAVSTVAPTITPSTPVPPTVPPTTIPPSPTTPPATMPPTSIPPTTVAPATRPPASPPPATTVVPVHTNTATAPQSLALCPILATRTPPPGAATFTPGGSNPPRGPIDPHVEICGSASTVRVGETLTITARSVDIGVPYFSLGIIDGEPAKLTNIVMVTYDNRIQGPTKSSTSFELVSAKGSISEATFVLRALHSGMATIGVSATGEIHYGYPGPATWAGGSADPAVVKIVDR